MKIKLMYSPRYDCLMICKPIYSGSHWYNFENDPWSYGGCTAHKMDFLINFADFVLVDQWNETQSEELTKER